MGGGGAGRGGNGWPGRQRATEETLALKRVAESGADEVVFSHQAPAIKATTRKNSQTRMSKL